MAVGEKVLCSGKAYEASVIAVPQTVSFTGRGGISDGVVFLGLSKDAVFQDNGPVNDFPQRGMFVGLGQKAISSTCSKGATGNRLQCMPLASQATQEEEHLGPRS